MLPTPHPLATAPDARSPSLSALTRTGGDTGRRPAPHRLRGLNLGLGPQKCLLLSSLIFF
jgi:hypothetical protein